VRVVEVRNFGSGRGAFEACFTPGAANCRKTGDQPERCDGRRLESISLRRWRGSRTRTALAGAGTGRSEPRYPAKPLACERFLLFHGGWIAPFAAGQFRGSETDELAGEIFRAP